MPPKLILETTAYTKPQLVTTDIPQVALAGRSNVGKSSLINCLAGRKALAKISSTPGKTRSINYYRAGSGLYVVDLPGYGYARCSKTERQKWAELIDHYLATSPSLKAVAVLLDCRLKPQGNDLDLTGYIREKGLTLIPVLTKIDKCKQNEQNTRRREWEAILGKSEPVILFSSKTGRGRDELWRRLLSDASAGETQPEAE